MRKLEEFISEKLTVSKIGKKYKPKTKEELVKIIIEEIKENGPNCYLNHIDVSNITDMSYLFLGGVFRVGNDSHPILSDFDGDISGWDVSNVTNMEDMFCRCKYSGNVGDISGWDVSSVTNMSGMFEYSNYNGDISDWDVSNVRDMGYMFADIKYTGDISKWDVSSVTNMSGMFYASTFTSDISDWDVSNVRDMSYMFEKSKYNGDLSNWDVSNVKRFTHMFTNSSFRGDISNWKINPVAKDYMERMFSKSPLEKTPPIWYKKH